MNHRLCDWTATWARVVPTSRGALLGALSALLITGAACSPSPTTLLDAVVFPTAARPGDTVALVVDSNMAPLDHLENPSLDTGNVTIRIAEVGNPTCFQDLASPDIRAVFEAGSARSSRFTDVVGFAGATVTVAVIDLPSTVLGCAPSPPYDAELTLLEGGTPSAYVQGPLKIVPGTGAPVELLYGTMPNLAQDLRSKPALRLQASDSFPSTTIGAIEFDLTVPSDPTTCVSEPKAFPGTELGLATAIVGPENAGTYHILVADPKGAQLIVPGQGDPGAAGEGPLLDITFTKSCGFDPEAFEIQNLVITGIDGSVPVDLRSVPGDDGSGTYFLAYAVEND